MKNCALMLLFISSSACIDLKFISKRNSVDGCIDWSVDLKQYQTLVGEPLRLKCALFYSYIRTNYSMAQNAKLRLIWYKNKGDSEEPIIFSGHRLSKEEDSIWFRTAVLEDSGYYTCVLRNSTYCMKVSMSLTVEESDPGLCYSHTMRYHETAEVTKPKTLTCPDIEDYLAPYKQPRMTWYKECQVKSWRSSFKVNTTTIWILEVEEEDSGNYTCELKYGTRLVRRTIELKVTALLTTKPPKVLFPTEKPPSTVEAQIGLPFSLNCQAFFGYSGESRPIIYWMRGEKFVEELEGHIRESEVRILREYLGEKEVELSLTFDTVEEMDLGNYTCYVENQIGRKQGNAILCKKVELRMELASGVGAVLLLLGLLTAVYKCYKVEIMLCCHRRCGGNEAEDDNKEYDAYLSYTKADLEPSENDCSMVEQFAAEVLPEILEKHHGYKLFIPDRDLIPSNIYLEDMARSLEQSRRLIIVLTPNFVASRSWSIFLLEARLHSMLVTGKIKVIMIECPDLRDVVHYEEVEALKHTIKLLVVVKWHGPESSQLRSRFWKQILCQMPVRRQESFSCRQVLDAGEQGLFADIQEVSTIAMTTTSASLAPSHAEVPAFRRVKQTHMKHYSKSYEFDMPSTPVRIAALGTSHMYCNIPMSLLNGQIVQIAQSSSPTKNNHDVHMNSTFYPLDPQEFTSDIW